MAAGHTATDAADRLTRRRAGLMTAMSAMLIIQQAAFFNAGDRWRLVDQVRTLGWLALVGVLLAILVTGGFWFKSREVRGLMNDEVSRANRASALTVGFVLAIVAAMILYAIEFWSPGEVSEREALHTIVTAGLLGAMIRFGLLERRALG